MQEAAGETLVQLLINTSDPNAAATALKRICEDCIARCAAMTEGAEAEPMHPPPSWAVKTLARLQLQAKDAAAAMTSLQNALRSNPSDVGLWELLGAAYQQLGRQSAASRVGCLCLQRLPAVCSKAVLHGLSQYYLMA
jgi:Flp pilus assembly protein TadD